MDFPTFESLVKQIKQPYDESLRNRASERYFEYISSQQADYLRNMLFLFQSSQDLEVVHFAAIILRKEISLRSVKSSLFSVPLETATLLLTVILQKLALSERDLARALGDLAGEIASHLIDSCGVVIDFVTQAFNQNETMQVEAAHIVSIISNANISKLANFGIERLLGFIQNALASQFYQANVHGIAAIQTILINY